MKKETNLRPPQISPPGAHPAVSNRACLLLDLNRIMEETSEEKSLINLGITPKNEEDMRLAV